MGFLVLIWDKIYIFLLFALPWLIDRGLKLLGIGLVAYFGVGALVDQFEGYVMTQFDSLPADIFALLVLAGVDDFIAMIFAAYTLLFANKVFSSMKVKNANTLAA